MLRRWLAGTPFDDVAYWLTVAAVYFLVGVLFVHSGKAKLFEGHGKPPTATGNNARTASIDGYFGATAIVIVLVLLLPPNRPRAWLSALVAR